VTEHTGPIPSRQGNVEQKVMDACYAYVASVPFGELAQWPDAFRRIFPNGKVFGADYWHVYRCFQTLEAQGKVEYLSHRGWRLTT
jgi:hypothetical protein